MSSKTDSSIPSDSPQLDQLTLWLNYENKMDELRSRFLTIASLLFTLQSGIFALMLDKIFLSDEPSSLTLPAELLLIVLSILTLIFLSIATSLYSSHIERNFYRSKFVVEESNTIRGINDIRVFKEKLNEYVGQKSTENKPRELKGAVRKLKRAIYQVFAIYLVLFLFTVGMPVLRKVLN